MKRAAAGALRLAASLWLLASFGTAAAQPEVAFTYPEEGAALAAPPPFLQMCFAAPVNILDLDKGGDFSFRVIRPDERALGLRIIFQSDGFGVQIQPGLQEAQPDGEWRLEWRVTEPETLEPREGVIHFTVAGGGEPPLSEPFGRCPTDGSPPLRPGETPAAGSGPSAATATAVNDADEAADSSGDLPLAAVIGAVAGAGVVGALLVFLLRRRTRGRA